MQLQNIDVWKKKKKKKDQNWYRDYRQTAPLA